MKFTYTHSLQAEKTLLEALRVLREKLDLHVDSKDLLKAVVLGGGYGRGEGGATADGRLYNDLDFWVIQQSGSARTGLDGLFKDIQEELKKLTLIDVDFYFIDDLATFYSINGNTLMAQELFTGHFVAWGDNAIFAKAPLISMDEIPWREGARLLLNRGAGLFLALLELSKLHPDIDFIRRNINKAILGCGDALLIARKLYCVGGMDRLNEIQLLDAEAELAILYEGALRAKYTPNPEELESLDSLEMQYEVALKIYLNAIVEFTSVIVGKTPINEVVAIEYLLEHGAAKPDDPVKNLILSFLYGWNSNGLLFPSTEHPRLKLMRLLIKSLLLRREVPGFLRLWQRFN